MQPTANLWEALCGDLQRQRLSVQRDEYVRVAEEFVQAARRVLRPRSARLVDAEEIAGDICREAGALTPAANYYREAYGRASDLNLESQAGRIAAKLMDLTAQRLDWRGAISWGRMALAHYEKVGDHSQHTNLLTDIGACLRKLGDFSAAVDCYRQAIAVNADLHGPHNPERAILLNNLGVALTESGDNDGAERAYLEALSLREAFFGSNHPEVAHSLTNLGVLHHIRGNVDSARRYYEAALQVYGNFFGPDAPEISNLQANLRRLSGMG